MLPANEKMKNLKELRQYLDIPRDITIVVHRNPDGDAIGSALGLYHVLNQMGHTLRLLAPSEYPPVLNWMPAVEEFIIYDLKQQEAMDALKRADLVFALDFNALDRIDKMGEYLNTSDQTIVMIDHHLDPEPYATLQISDQTASSTCEVLYLALEQMGMMSYVNKTVATCLYTGILTDTGAFAFSLSSRLFRIAGELLDLGVDNNLLQDLLFNQLPEKHLRLLGYCLYERMEILPEYHTGIITLSKKDYERFKIQRGDTEGIVNYLLKIKGIKLAAFIHEQPTITKLSLRSKGDFSVKEIAQKYFKGGGHKNAAGGHSYKGLEATVKKFKSVLDEYKDQLADPVPAEI